MMKPFTPGLAYKEGKLYRFRDGEAEVIRAWPPTAWRASWTQARGRSPWSPCRPDISITRMGYEVRRESESPAPALAFAEADVFLRLPAIPTVRAPLLPFPDPRADRQGRRVRVLEAFLAEIPDEAQAAIRRLPSRQFHALSVLCRCPGPAAEDLSRHNPALFFALCSIWVFHPRPPRWAMRSIRSLLGKRQARICEALGFPGTRSAARVLRRVVPACLGTRHGISRLLSLRDALRAGNPLLGHLPRINAGVVRLLDPALAPHVTPRLLLDIAHSRANDSVPRDAFDLHDTVRMLGFLEPRRRAVFRSLEHSRSEHLAAIDLMRVRNLRVAGILDRPLPPPPFEGNDEVRPCETSESIVTLGRDARNCVAGYIPSVASGASYVYRVDTEGRPATLELRPDSTGSWRIRQFRGFGNQDPSPQVRAAVTRWWTGVRQGQLPTDSLRFP